MVVILHSCMKRFRMSDLSKAKRKKCVFVGPQIRKFTKLRWLCRKIIKEAWRHLKEVTTDYLKSIIENMLVVI